METTEKSNPSAVDFVEHTANVGMTVMGVQREHLYEHAAQGDGFLRRHPVLPRRYILTYKAAQ